MDALIPSVPALLVLSVLDEGPAHGYEIARRVEQASDAVLALREGTMYPLLYKLEGDGFVRAQWRDDAGRRRVRVYTLTEAGARRLARERERWAARSGAVDRVLGRKGAGAVGHA